MVSSSPSTLSRMPVSTGRASSREAALATRSIVSRSGSIGSSSASPSGSPKRGKSSAGRVRRWKLEEPAVISTSRSASRSARLTSPSGSERTMSTRSRPGRTTLPCALGLHLGDDLQAELGVGGTQPQLTVLDGDQNAGQGLQGSAGRDGSRDDLKGIEKCVALGCEFHGAGWLNFSRSSKGCGFLWICGCGICG